VRIVETNSPEETRAVAKELAEELKIGDVVLLEGDLGAGKTTFIQGLAEGLGVPEDYYVSSPTFALINEYPGRLTLYHIDLYRLEPEEVEDLGLEDLLAQGVLAIEWAERLPFSFPRGLSVRLKVIAPTKRRLEIAPLQGDDHDI